MPTIKVRGSYKARLWFIQDRPFGSDEPQGFVMSGGLGKVWDKMLREASIDPLECCFVARAPDTDTPTGYIGIDGVLQQEKPPLICVLNECGSYFLPELRQKGEDSRGQLQKYAGSLLSCDRLGYPHYMSPVYGPDRCMADWTERNITTYIDLQKIKDELAHFKKFNTLRPLPERTLIYHDIPFDELISYIESFSNSQFISNDIENPTYKTEIYKPHPGYPFLLGLADSPNFGISFRLFRDSPSENRKLWRSLDSLYKKVTLIGQNFFNYDALFHNALGFNIDLHRVQDTLI